MADSVAIKTIASGKDKSIFLLTNRSDGTGETSVTKIDISALPGAPSRVKISRLEWAVEGMSVELFFDRSSPDRAFICAGQGALSVEGIQDDGTGGTGDIKLSTIGHTAGDTYSIMIEVKSEQ
jgi:hypothetical protein